VGHTLCHQEEADDLLFAQVVPPRDMPLGYDEAVALCEWIDVEQAEGALIFVYHVRRRAARRNLAENAASTHTGHGAPHRRHLSREFDGTNGKPALRRFATAHG
jgi:hypothetical protein